jgi:hypothetical protein
MQIKAIGIPWYTRENYRILKATMRDGKVLPDTFDEWLAKANEVRKRYIAQGYLVAQAELDIKAFPAWCKANGHKVDAEGRTAYANLVAFQTYNKAQ